MGIDLHRHHLPTSRLGLYHSFSKRTSGKTAAPLYRAEKGNHCRQVVGTEVEQGAAAFLVIKIGVRVMALYPVGAGKGGYPRGFSNQAFIDEPPAGLDSAA